MAMTNFQQAQIGLGALNAASNLFMGWQNQKWAKGNSAAASKRNLLMMQAQMDWQERMDNTKYQRAVKDMHAAGLNPILAAGNVAAGGQSAPSGGNAAGGRLPPISSAGMESLQGALNSVQTNKREDATSAATVAKLNAETARIIAENPYAGKKAKADAGKAAAEELHQNIENQMYKDSYQAELTKRFAEVESAVSKGRIDIANAKFLEKYGVTKEEAMRLGEDGLKALGTLITGGAALKTVRDVKNKLLGKKHSARH